MSDAKMIRLYGGSERPETKIDQEREQRLEQAERDVDPAGAFDICADMENTLLAIKKASAALRIISAADDLEENFADALHGLAETIDDATKNAEDARCQIFHKTWAYRYGSARVTAAGTGEAK